MHLVLQILDTSLASENTKLPRYKSQVGKSSLIRSRRDHKTRQKLVIKDYLLTVKRLAIQKLMQIFFVRCSPKSFKTFNKREVRQCDKLLVGVELQLFSRLQL